uniref:Uncharacterized protein n=1 Tax=Candidatus Methanogaster sp. ANME-2c ERB4 TaxID=2759911 RepID=A0A7G9YND6_9EURY|nr:hypothetical protein FBKNMHLG_00039 [Methanosarcinales archaeon ANME-2c ERB4]
MPNHNLLRHPLEIHFLVRLDDHKTVSFKRHLQRFAAFTSDKHLREDIYL